MTEKHHIYRHSARIFQHLPSKAVRRWVQAEQVNSYAQETALRQALRSHLHCGLD